MWCESVTTSTYDDDYNDQTSYRNGHHRCDRTVIWSKSVRSSSVCDWNNPVFLLISANPFSQLEQPYIPLAGLPLSPTMHQSDDDEMWDLGELLEKSPLSTLTADFEHFKARFASLLDGDFSQYYHEESSEEISPSPSSKCTSNDFRWNRMQAGSSSHYLPGSAAGTHTTNNRQQTAKRPNELPVTPLVPPEPPSGHSDMRLKYGYPLHHEEQQGQQKLQQHHVQQRQQHLAHQQEFSARPKTTKHQPRDRSQRHSAHNDIDRSSDYYSNESSKEHIYHKSGSLCDLGGTRYRDDHWYTDLPHDNKYMEWKFSHRDAYLNSDNKYVEEDSRMDHSPQEGDQIGATHRGTHRFVPRHDDEVAIEIGDPIHVLHEAEDLWCMGINLRTGGQGIFPSVYATDLEFYKVTEETTAKPPVQRTFQLHFLGSIEVSQHRGSDILVDAIQKIILNRRLSKDSRPPPLCQLDVSEAGIKMIDLTYRKRAKKMAADLDLNTQSVTQRLSKLLAFSRESKAVSNHFFSLKNISFCGYHPDNPRYFGFITKHPSQRRFACHCFSSTEGSTQVIVDAIGEAFHHYYCGYMAFNHHTEDIYLE